MENVEEPIPPSRLADEDGEPIPSRIAKASINEMPLKAYEGSVHLVSKDEEIPEAVEKLRSEPILGFDTETKPAFKKGVDHPVALLQLATSEEVYLFQLLQLEEIEPIWDLLSDPAISKVGVAITDDVKKLQDRLAFEPGGFEEIATLTQKHGIMNTGLRSLGAMLLGFRISKRAQLSNWAKVVLTEAQITYAATDAWLSREIYCYLRENTEPVPTE